MPLSIFCCKLSLIWTVKMTAGGAVKRMNYDRPIYIAMTELTGTSPEHDHGTANLVEFILVAVV